ncbi:MAG: radical SAM protein [Clostridia bacterium]|nr:radical SAM protein [Clostridia bacterium]
MLSSTDETTIIERETNLCGDIILNEKNTSFEKYSLGNLDIEITRRCNFTCKHCGRGKAQNLTMTREIIDRLFSQIKNVTGGILLTGGEVALEMDIIAYFVNKLINCDWTPKELQIGTNGTCMEANQRLIELLCKVAKEKNILGAVFISDDLFHAECDKENLRYKSLDYFKSEVKKRGMLFNPNKPDDDKGKVNVFVKDLKESDGNDGVVVIGNAREYMEEISQKGVKLLWAMDDELFMCNNHKIQIIDGVIGCTLSVLANGNISIWQNYDYDRADKYCLGNILSEDFKPIIDNHNEKRAIYQCFESKNYLNLRANNEYNRDFPKDMRELFRFMELKYKLTFRARQDALRLYPELSADEIVALFPVLTDYEWLMMPEFSNYGTPQTPREAINIITNCRNDYGIYSSPRDYRENAIRIIVDEYISQKS